MRGEQTQKRLYPSIRNKLIPKEDAGKKTHLQEEEKEEREEK